MEKKDDVRRRSSSPMCQRCTVPGFCKREKGSHECVDAIVKRWVESLGKGA